MKHLDNTPRSPLDSSGAWLSQQSAVKTTNVRHIGTKVIVIRLLSSAVGVVRASVKFVPVNAGVESGWSLVDVVE